MLKNIGILIIAITFTLASCNTQQGIAFDKGNKPQFESYVANLKALHHKIDISTPKEKQLFHVEPYIGSKTGLPAIFAVVGTLEMDITKKKVTKINFEIMHQPNVQTYYILKNIKIDKGIKGTNDSNYKIEVEKTNKNPGNRIPKPCSSGTFTISKNHLSNIELTGGPKFPITFLSTPQICRLKLIET